MNHDNDDNHGGKRNRGRWKKGVSGNPNGRPRKKPAPAPADLIGFLLRELEEKVEVTQGGERTAVLVGRFWAKRVVRELLHAKGAEFARLTHLVMGLLKHKPRGGTIEEFNWTEEQEALFQTILRASEDSSED